jgi:hypothetical protein
MNILEKVWKVTDMNTVIKTLKEVAGAFEGNV